MSEKKMLSIDSPYVAAGIATLSKEIATVELNALGRCIWLFTDTPEVRNALLTYQHGDLGLYVRNLKTTRHQMRETLNGETARVYRAAKSGAR